MTSTILSDYEKATNFTSFVKGKHAGKEYLQVWETDPSYIEWCSVQEGVSNKMKENLKAVMLQPRDHATMKVSFGKYKGVSLGDVKAENPKYLDWLLQLDNIQDCFRTSIEHVRSA